MRFPALVGSLCALAMVFPLAAVAAAPPAGKLSITFIDVEGGQSTLFVGPDGKSLLIDTGWDDHDGRDADRIVAAAHKLGVKKLDYVLITHFHDDHVGGVPNLVKKIPVGTFLDHGENREHGDKSDVIYAAYLKVIADGHYSRINPKPGDTRQIGALTLTTISADAKVLTSPLAGAGAKNEFCPATAPEADTTENQRSLGSLITFGKLRILDLGDLTKDEEFKLMCPINRLGRIDLLVVSHHGWYQSSSPELVDAIRPLVSIMDNGATKGGSTATLETLSKIPAQVSRWQLHYSIEGGAKLNPDPKYIADIEGEPDLAHTIVVEASPTGSFSVTNTRTGYTQKYFSRH
jgi:competence protein ComEC